MIPHDVSLLGVPVRAWLRLQEHTDALLREYRLMRQHGLDRAPPELLRLFATVQAEFPRSAVPELRSGVKAAREAGVETADVHASVTPSQSRLLRLMHESLAEIDQYCRAGLLLTLPLEPDALHLRGWVVEEIARQLEGEPPGPYRRDANVV